MNDDRNLRTRTERERPARAAAVALAVLVSLASVAPLAGAAPVDATQRAQPPTGSGPLPVDDSPSTEDPRDADAGTDDPRDTDSGTKDPRGTDPGGDETTGNRTGTTPPDPEEDVLGWEGGYWYNESIAVDQSDGLNETELSKVVNRSMARVERIRELEFEKTVPVEVVSRETYAESISGRYENVSDEARLHFRIKFESRFFVGENRTPIEAVRTGRTLGFAGFYLPTSDRIVVISENTTSPKLDEITLAQELFHALQDQRFPEFFRDRFVGPYTNGTLTTEGHNAFDALFEGDGTYVDFLYERRCEAEWDCLLPGERPGGAGEINLGIRLTVGTPYGDGPPFVRSVRERGGWEAVNELYETPPASTEQVIHPGKYPEDAPTDVTVADRSTPEWRPLGRAADGVGLGLPQTSAANMSFGEAGIFVMLWFAGHRAGGEDVVVRYDVFDQPGIDRYDLNATASAGWDGDLLVPYVTDDSAETNETGYVWKTVWDSPEDAEEFREGYLDLLNFYGAREVEGRQDTYRIPDDRQFGDAFYVNHSGSTVTIVNAPSVAELPAVRAGAAPEVGTTPTPAGTSGEEQRGFGVAVAVVAVLAALLVLRRRRD